MAWHEGDVIRKLRTLYGWRLGPFAAHIGVSFTTINKIELGKTKEPKRATLDKIAKGFGLTARQLLDAVPKELLIVEDGHVERALNQARQAARSDAELERGKRKRRAR